MIQLSIDAELEATLNAITARTGEAPEELARKALLAYLENLEDYATAVEAWKEHQHGNGATTSLDDLMARHDVAG